MVTQTIPYLVHLHPSTPLAAPASFKPWNPAKLVMLLSLSTAIVIIYSDLIRHNKVISDIYKIQKINNWLCLEVEGKVVYRKSVTSMTLSVVEKPLLKALRVTAGVDIVMNHLLAGNQLHQRSL